MVFGKMEYTKCAIFNSNVYKSVHVFCILHQANSPDRSRVTHYRTSGQRALGNGTQSTTALPRGNPPQKSAWPYGSLDLCHRHIPDSRNGAALPNRVRDLHVVMHEVCYVNQCPTYLC